MRIYAATFRRDGVERMLITVPPSTKGSQVRFLLEEPSLSATNRLRLPVDGGQARTAQIGQYLRNTPLSGRQGTLAEPPRTPR